MYWPFSSERPGSTTAPAGKVADTVADPADTTAGTSAFFAPRGLQRVAPRAVVLALIVWWWPSLTGAGDHVNVILAGDQEIVADSNPVIRRLRERGLEVEVHPEWTSWCDAADALGPRMADLDAEAVVLSFRHEGRCPTAVGQPDMAVDRLARSAAAENIALVVVAAAQGDVEPPVAEAVGRLQANGRVAVADAGRLLGGDQSAQRVNCEWWDDCGPAGLVAVRDERGALTEAGLERVARVVVAVVP